MTAIPTVAIGASAGGIDAFRRFFENAPPQTGLAFIVVLHLAANRKSMLPEIVARWTQMPVREARDGDEMKPDHVLVIPGGVVATIQENRLLLRSLAADVREPAPIDILFDSLASNAREDAIGVVLSGTGHDGALGLKAIKAHGGLTLAQGTDGSGPEYAGMPDSAVAAGGVDILVPAEQMVSHILEARNTRTDAEKSVGEAAERLNSVRLAICDIIRSRLGHDFSHYKEQTFMRRVQRRMQVLRLSRLDDYLARLETDQDQVIMLFRDLLISVTKFLRDPAAFQALQQKAVPRLFAGKDASSTVRVWVTGCSTGEEAYSLAMLLREHMDTLSTLPKVQIFASDVDEAAIAAARAGRYPPSLLEGVSEERRQRFFIETTAGYTVRQDLRDMCTFSAHSLIRDPPFSRIDLVSCRNLLIYMDNVLQDQIIPIFHYALVPDGVLFLGVSENVARFERLFTPLDLTHRIFTRTPGNSETPKLSLLVEPGVRAAGAEVTARPDPKEHAAQAVASATRRVLDRFAAPFVVVTAKGEILHYSRNTGRFLETPEGLPTTNVFDLVRPLWALELRRTLRRCIEAGKPVEQDITVIEPGTVAANSLTLVVEPLPVGEAAPLYMIVFIERERPPAASETVRPFGGGRPKGVNPGGANPGGADTGAANAEGDRPGGLISQLEQANLELREQLQAVTEEHATAMEELRSSNEELQSVNEEMQSANEELETSREEIQSVNEELNTVNLQLTAKLEQLDRANGDLRNLFESTKVATVFLDSHLIIRSFTPEIAAIYNLIPSDEGRPLTDIVSRLSYGTLREDVQHVLQTLEPLEKRVDRVDGSTHYLMRILPYRSPNNAIDGSLVTFVDVTSIVRAEAHQRLLVDELNHRVKNMLTVVISLASNTVRRSRNLEQFSDVFLGRIHALTAAYTLLSREGWAPVRLRDVLMEELKPFLDDEHSTVDMDGPAVLVPPRAALALGMAIHELTTNAVKYGALSIPEGRVGVAWMIEPSTETLTLEWVEHDGPAVRPPDRRGFGMTVIERGLEHDLGGTVRIDFAAAGLRATLQTPLRDRRASDQRAAQAKGTVDG